jgi:hypothetical protein
MPVEPGMTEMASLATIAPMPPPPTTFESWLDETFGRAVTGETYPQFVHRDVAEWPGPVPNHLALGYLTRVFENSEETLRYFSDGQIAAGLWELGPGDAHCVDDRDLPIEARERLIGSVATFFRDFFERRCVPKLSHGATEHISPLNSICYMWWEVITWGWAKDDPAGERLSAKDLDVMEAVLQLPNPACKEAALHGLGHMVRYSDRACAIIDGFLTRASDCGPELLQYARSARTGCIQ